MPDEPAPMMQTLAKVSRAYQVGWPARQSHTGGRAKPIFTGVRGREPPDRIPQSFKRRPVLNSHCDHA